METFFMQRCPETRLGYQAQWQAWGPLRGLGSRGQGDVGSGPNQDSPTAMSPKLEMVLPLSDVTTMAGATAGHHSSRNRVL